MTLTNYVNHFSQRRTLSFKTLWSYYFLLKFTHTHTPHTHRHTYVKSYMIRSWFQVIWKLFSKKLTCLESCICITSCLKFKCKIRSVNLTLSMFINGQTVGHTYEQTKGETEGQTDGTMLITFVVCRHVMCEKCLIRAHLLSSRYMKCNKFK